MSDFMETAMLHARGDDLAIALSNGNALSCGAVLQASLNAAL